jgi:hypothetical protein
VNRTMGTSPAVQPLWLVAMFCTDALRSDFEYVSAEWCDNLDSKGLVWDALLRYSNSSINRHIIIVFNGSRII